MTNPDDRSVADTDSPAAPQESPLACLVRQRTAAAEAYTALQVLHEELATSGGAPEREAAYQAAVDAGRLLAYLSDASHTLSVTSAPADRVQADTPLHRLFRLRAATVSAYNTLYRAYEELRDMDLHSSWEAAYEASGGAGILLTEIGQELRKHAVPAPAEADGK